MSTTLGKDGWQNLHLFVRLESKQAAQQIGRDAGDHHPGLDGVRGLAILLVMIYHMTLLEPSSNVGSLVLAVANAGWIGVDLFFVLSGYLISGILLDMKREGGSIGRFWMRRALRILPLYYAVVAFSLIVLPSIDHPKTEIIRTNQRRRVVVLVRVVEF